MGWFFHNGFGVRRDLKKARTWYEIAARRRDPRAWFSLGQLAFDQLEFVEALSWFRRAVRSEHPRSAYYLGRMYLEGLGVTRDPSKAAELLRAASQLGVKPAGRLFRSRRFAALRRG